MIESSIAIKELLDRGLTPKIVQDPDNPNIDHFFIEKTVVWDKLFCSLEQSLKESIEGGNEGLNSFYKSIKHRKWVKNLIIAHDLKLNWVKSDKGYVLAVVFPEMMKRGNDLPRLNENMNKWMFLITTYLRILLEEFEL